MTVMINVQRGNLRNGASRIATVFLTGDVAYVIDLTVLNGSLVRMVQTRSFFGTFYTVLHKDS